jgi:tetratricopeptide (TPR) repeat protein
VLQLIPFNNASLVADRYVYLPIVGLAFLLSQLVELAALEMSKHSVKTIEIKNVFFGLLVLLLLIPSLQRITVWRNSLTLFDDVIQKNNHIGIAYGNRAETKIKRSDFAGALADCEQLVALRPDDGQAFYEKGNTLLAMHRERDAIRNFTYSMELGFVKATVFYNRGLAYYSLEIVDSAVADFHTSRSLDSAFADAPYSIGYVSLHSQGDALRAVAYFDSALAIKPNYAEASYQKAAAEYTLHAYGNTLEDLSAAIDNQPSLKNDTLVAEVNRSVDSVNALITAIKDVRGKYPMSVNSKMRLRQMYLVLGDTLRANAGIGSILAQNDGRARR